MKMLGVSRILLAEEFPVQFEAGVPKLHAFRLMCNRRKRLGGD